MLRYDGSMFIECVRPIQAANPPDHRSQWGLNPCGESPPGLEGDSPNDTNTSPPATPPRDIPPQGIGCGSLPVHAVFLSLKEEFSRYDVQQALINE